MAKNRASWQAQPASLLLCFVISNGSATGHYGNEMIIIIIIIIMIIPSLKGRMSQK